MTLELTTFSAILTFAINLEGELAHFYESAALVSGELADVFKDYARKSAKRRQRLIAIRQDNVTEIVLEPISGLDAAAYEIDPMTATPPADADSVRCRAVELETRARQFYLEAGAKLNVTEPRRAFQKFAQEADERLSALGH